EGFTWAAGTSTGRGRGRTASWTDWGAGLTAGATGARLGRVTLSGAGAAGAGPGKGTCQLSRGSDGRRTGGTLAGPLLPPAVAAARSAAAPLATNWLARAARQMSRDHFI